MLGSLKKAASGTKAPFKMLLKPVVFIASLLPFAAIVYAVLSGESGPNPIEFIEQETGEWSIRFLLLSLAMTPLTEMFKIAWPVRIRRMIGLFAFFYVLVHFLSYVVLDQSLNLQDIFADLMERPFMAAGFVGFVILIPLAVTSNRAMVRKLKSRWKALHRWVYVAGIAGVLHYVWLAKGEILDPIVYLVILVVLLGWRTQRLLGGK